MLIKRTLFLLLTSGLAAHLLRRLGEQRQQRLAHHERTRHREDVQRWEDEGGNHLPSHG